MLLTSFFVWDLLSTFWTVRTTKSTKEFARLRSTSGDLVLGFGKITPSLSNYRSGSTPLAFWIFCNTAARRGAHAAAKRLNAFHFRCLRSILGILWRDYVSTSTILHVTDSYDPITIMRQRRLRWLGHVHRMEDGWLPKDILYGELYKAPRRTDKPKLLWAMQKKWRRAELILVDDGMGDGDVSHVFYCNFFNSYCLCNIIQLFQGTVR